MIFYIIRKYNRLTVIFTVLTFAVFLYASVSALILGCSCVEKTNEQISCCCKEETKAAESDCCGAETDFSEYTCCNQNADGILHKSGQGCNTCTVETAPLEIPLQIEKKYLQIADANDILNEILPYQKTSEQNSLIHETKFTGFREKIFLVNSVLRI